MLVIVCVTVALCAIAIFATVKVTRVVMDRFGLDSMTVMLWLGLAEWPSEAETPRRQRVERAAVEGPGRRRRGSPHRPLGRRLVRRRATG